MQPVRALPIIPLFCLLFTATAQAGPLPKQVDRATLERYEEQHETDRGRRLSDRGKFKVAHADSRQQKHRADPAEHRQEGTFRSLTDNRRTDRHKRRDYFVQPRRHNDRHDNRHVHRWWRYLPHRYEHRYHGNHHQWQRSNQSWMPVAEVKTRRGRPAERSLSINEHIRSIRLEGRKRDLVVTRAYMETASGRWIRLQRLEGYLAAGDVRKVKLRDTRRVRRLVFNIHPEGNNRGHATVSVRPV